MQFLVPSSQEPIAWWRGKPLSMTIVLIVLHIVAVAATSLLMGLEKGDWLSAILFDNQQVIRGEVWRLFTFPFYQYPTIWLLIELLMLWMFGTQVEQTLGWRRFLSFYAILTYAPALVFVALTPWKHLPLTGTEAPNFGLFIGFATLFPEAPMLFNTKAKWWAWALLGLIILQMLAASSIIATSSLIGATAAYLYLKLVGVRGGFNWLNHWRDRRQADRYERALRRRHLESKDHFISEQVDPILDKISREGIQSLTEEERRILERAKDKLR